jgi:hypothetical protein
MSSSDDDAARERWTATLEATRGQPRWLAVDAEFDGPDPRRNSCIMMSALVYRLPPDAEAADSWDAPTGDGVLDRFSVCIHPREDRAAHRGTTERFWALHWDTRRRIHAEAVPYADACAAFAAWVRATRLGAEAAGVALNWICKPLTSDWKWIEALMRDGDPDEAALLPRAAFCLEAASRLAEKEADAVAGAGRGRREIVAPTVAYAGRARLEPHWAADDCLLQAHLHAALWYAVPRAIEAARAALVNRLDDKPLD